jgi:hypothetical protein
MRTPHPSHRLRAVVAVLFVLALAACDAADVAGDATEPVTGPAAAADGAEGAGPADAADPAVAVVHKSPTCECCGAHEDYLASEGHPTQPAVHEADLTAWKEQRGIPRELWSCHTTEIGGYLVEGHVPVETIARLLEEQPAIDGIALAGMPGGSPGMGGVQEEPFVIEAFVGGAPAGVFDTR